MKTKGIVYIAFGEEFDKLTVATAGYSRKFTQLPICVLTNLKERNIAWKNVSDVCFKFISLPSEENRRIKVSLIDYTPYDETLFIDSDAVVQNYGIESLFDYLQDFDLACQYYGIVDQRDSHLKFYKRTYGRLAKLLGESYPIELFGEAALLFRKTEASQKFFTLWKKYWGLMDCGRDMPGFGFAVKHSEADVKVFRTQGKVVGGIGYYSDLENRKSQDRVESKVRFCTNTENRTFFIQHKGFKNFENKFGLPKYQDWSPKL